MEVDCEGCAGCCLDWRPLTDADLDRERRGRYAAVDDAYNLAPLTRDEVRAFVEAGLGDALRPRLYAAVEGPTATVDGTEVAAVGGRPAFLVGLRKPPKPVAPFGREPTWLRTCAFLDPTTLQCRLHGGDLYPETCRTYPGANLHLDAETECERVEAIHGGDRLLDDEPPEDAAPRVGRAAVGSTVFAHPAPERLDGVVERMRTDALTREDRAELVAVAAASSPGTLAISEAHYERARERVLEADSWVGRAAADWRERAGEPGSPAADPAVAEAIEEGRGAPETPGWGAVEPAEE